MCKNISVDIEILHKPANDWQRFPSSNLEHPSVPRFVSEQLLYKHKVTLQVTLALSHIYTEETVSKRIFTCEQCLEGYNDKP